MSIIAKDVSFVYSKKEVFERTAVNNVSFEIEKGDFVGLIGHTGSGKSTLIQLLAGLIKPDSGSVCIDGIDVTSKKCDVKKLRSKVGIVFQYPEYQLFEETVYRDIAFGPSNLGMAQDEIEAAVYEVIADIGLSSDVLDKSPFELSGGQKRKVAIAGVLAMKPEILILDEPTAGLDPKARRNLLSLIKKLNKDKHITIILVSHSMEDIAGCADKVMVMSDGSLVMYDKTENIFSKSSELKKIGLDVPQISLVVEKLKQNGINIGENIFNVKDAAEAIISYLNNKQ